MNPQGQPAPDAFRRGLGYAVQWYDNLRVRVERRVEAALVEAEVYIGKMSEGLDSVSISANLTPPMMGPLSPESTHPFPPHPPSTEHVSDPSSLTPGECARILQQRCPLCFGGRLFGRPLQEYVISHIASILH